jgi:hypothetical protein
MFVYNGTTPINVDDCTINGVPAWTTANPAVNGAVVMMYVMGGLREEFQTDFGGGGMVEPLRRIDRNGDHGAKTH